MEKLKKYNVRIVHCPTCKGNGYLKVATESEERIHQCWDCDSEGEFYIHEPTTNKFDDAVDLFTDDDTVKIH
tara:strand:+ start:31 stop:246 length:216 start_codon:yes stop_codon:yes gene_type:complete